MPDTAIVEVAKIEAALKELLRARTNPTVDEHRPWKHRDREIEIRRHGERLFELGGLKLMVDACQRAADASPTGKTSRTNILNQVWSGIGASESETGWLP